MKRIHTKLQAMVAVLFAVILAVTAYGAAITASADTPAYSDVLDDFGKDSIFNADEYPLVPGDYTLQVIQIAESERGELFLYVYQPCGETKKYAATSVNISQSIHESLHYENYDVTQLSNQGVFAKYKVEGLELKKDALRYYDISAIYRKWDNAVDGRPEYGNTGVEKAFAVAQQWTACTVNGNVTYNMLETETIEVTQEVVGFRRYSDGFSWSGIEHCDAHFLAFSTEHAIDTLLSADVEFYTQTYRRLEGQEIALNDDRTKRFVTVNYDDEGASSKEKWQRMSSTSDFIDGTQISEKEAEMLSKYDWILNFYETPYEREFGGKDILITFLVPGGWIWATIDACTTNGTIVTEVMLMRLEFEYQGKIYNLGVVSDKLTGSGQPTNSGQTSGFGGIGLDGTKSGMPWWGWLIVLTVVLLAVWIVINLFASKRQTRSQVIVTQPQQPQIVYVTPPREEKGTKGKTTNGKKKGTTAKGKKSTNKKTDGKVGKK